MTSNTDLTRLGTATTRPLAHPLRARMPGTVTYLVLAVWSGVVTTAIVAGVFAGGGASQLLLPASQAIPIAAVAILYRVWPRFRNYLLTLDLRLVLAAQLWRVIGIAFLSRWRSTSSPRALPCQPASATSPPGSLPWPSCWPWATAA